MTTSTLKYGRWSVDANTLPPKAIAYLLSNGFNQSMTDAAAATKEEKAKALRGAGHEDDARKVEGTERKPTLSDEGATHLASVIDAWREERFQDILRGEVGTRVGGARIDPLTRAMREVAEARVRVIAEKRKVAMPIGKTLSAAIETLIARDGDAIRTEARANLTRAKAAMDAAGDLGDIFGTEGTAEEPEQAAA